MEPDQDRSFFIESSPCPTSSESNAISFLKVTHKNAPALKKMAFCSVNVAAVCSQGHSVSRPRSAVATCLVGWIKNVKLSGFRRQEEKLLIQTEPESGKMVKYRGQENASIALASRHPSKVVALMFDSVVVVC
jgi:hypothetical protein